MECGAMTQGERLARIEAILEQSLVKQLDGMAKDIKAIRIDLDADKAELKALKNKGAGILIGVGLAGGAVGAAVLKGLQSLFS